MFDSELLAIKAHRKMTFISPIWPFSKPWRRSVDKQKRYDDWPALLLKYLSKAIEIRNPYQWHVIATSKKLYPKGKKESNGCHVPSHGIGFLEPRSQWKVDHVQIKNWLFFRVISPPKGQDEMQRDGQGVQNAVLHLVAAQNNGATISKDRYCS